MRTRALLDRLRDDRVLASVLAVTTLVAALAQGFGPARSIAGAALCAPLVGRSRHPVSVLAAVVLAAVLYLALVNDFPAYAIPAAVALYTVAVQGTRGRTLVVGALLVPCAAATVVAFPAGDGSTLGQVFELVVQLGFALAIGEAVRSGRALIAAMRERAEHVERERELETRRRVAEERMRVVREVHDVVAHSLATIATQASVGVHLAERDPERALATLGDVKAVSTDALEELRHALGGLRDADDEAATRPTPSLQALPELVDQARRSGLSVALRMQGSPGGLPAALQAAIYRIVQEALTNVMRHAGGAHATVGVVVEDGQVEVDVADDGSGAPTALSASGSGSGLIGMRERARALGGALQADRTPGGGFRVHAVLPVGGPRA